MRGIKQFKQFYKSGHEVREKHELERVISDAQDPVVVVEGRFAGARGSGTISLKLVDLFVFDAMGKIVERRTYTDQASV